MHHSSTDIISASAVPLIDILFFNFCCGTSWCKAGSKGKFFPELEGAQRGGQRSRACSHTNAARWIPLCVNRRTVLLGTILRSWWASHWLDVADRKAMGAVRLKGSQPRQQTKCTAHGQNWHCHFAAAQLRASHMCGSLFGLLCPLKNVRSGELSTAPELCVGPSHSVSTFRGNHCWTGGKFASSC